MSATHRDEILDALPVFDESLVERSPGAGDLWLVGWRCERCARLAFGVRRICPVCGGRQGRASHLEGVGELETWTTVHSREGGHYTVGYCLIGDGEDEQRVRVFGPIAVRDDGELRIGQRMEISFDHSHLAGREACHHVFHPGSAGAGA